MFKRQHKIAKPVRTVWKHIVLLAAGIVFCGTAKVQAEPVNDIFIGMVVEEKGQLILARCNLGSTRYMLYNAVGADDPVQKLQTLLSGNKKVQVELIASYRSNGETHILDVSAILDSKTGNTCNLIDALNEMTDAPETVQP